MTRTAILVDRTALGRAVLERHGTALVPDYDLLVSHLVPDDPGVLKHVWTVEMPPGMVRLFERYGWQVKNLPRVTPGLIEADMAMTVVNLPAACTRFIFVTGAGAISPVLARLAEDGNEVTVAAYASDIALNIRNTPGVKIVPLDHADILRKK